MTANIDNLAKRMQPSDQQQNGIEYVWVRSSSKMLLYEKFAEDKVLVFVILREKCETSSLCVE